MKFKPGQLVSVSLAVATVCVGPGIVIRQSVINESYTGKGAWYEVWSAMNQRCTILHENQLSPINPQGER